MKRFTLVLASAAAMFMLPAAAPCFLVAAPYRPGVPADLLENATPGPLLRVQRGRVFTPRPPVMPHYDWHSPMFDPQFKAPPLLDPQFKSPPLLDPQFKLPPIEIPKVPDIRIPPNVWENLRRMPIEEGLLLDLQRTERIGLAEQAIIGRLQIAGRPYHVDATNVSAWKDAVGSRRPPAAFIIARVAPESGARPVYLLITGEGEPQVFIGNSELRGLATEAVHQWKSAGGEPPPRLAMTGDGSLQDFDAALLTMRLSEDPPAFTGAASDSTPASGEPSASTAFDSLAPPPEFEDLPGFADRRMYVHADGASIQRSGDHYVGIAEFQGGKITVVGRTREFVAEILAAIREAIRDFLATVGAGSVSALSHEQRLALLQKQKMSAEAALAKIRTEEARSKDDVDEISVESILGDETVNWTVATLDEPPSRLFARTAP